MISIFFHHSSRQHSRERLERFAISAISINYFNEKNPFSKFHPLNHLGLACLHVSIYFCGLPFPSLSENTHILARITHLLLGSLLELDTFLHLFPSLEVIVLQFGNPSIISIENILAYACALPRYYHVASSSAILLDIRNVKNIKTLPGWNALYQRLQ